MPVDNVTVLKLCLLVFGISVKVFPGIFLVNRFKNNAIITGAKAKAKVKVKVKARVKARVKVKARARVKLITSHQVAFLKPHTSDSFDFIFID